MDKEYLKKLPNEFKAFTSHTGEYKLTKEQGKPGKATGVYPGMHVTGDLLIVDVQGNPSVMVMQTYHRYIRTSPIVKVIEVDGNSMTFETEGGIYLLEKIIDRSEHGSKM